MEIIDAFKHTNYENSSSASILSRIRENKPTILLAGPPNHSIGMLFFKDFLILCNRGSGEQTHAVEYYSLPSKNITEELICKLKNQYNSTAEFYKMIEDQRFTKVDGYHQKKQKIGNCPWATPKAIFGVLLRFYCNPSWARLIYKQFTKFTRTECLKDYIENSTFPDQTLINIFINKLKRKGIHFVSPRKEKELDFFPTDTPNFSPTD